MFAGSAPYGEDAEDEEGHKQWKEPIVLPPGKQEAFIITSSHCTAHRHVPGWCGWKQN